MERMKERCKEYNRSRTFLLQKHSVPESSSTSEVEKKHHTRHFTDVPKQPAEMYQASFQYTDSCSQ